MKIKTWDVTVKDNPNKVVMGENDEFYTSDTEAYLIFNLQDKFFRPRTAILTLENRNDGSLKSEEIAVVDGVIEWEMPQRYIEHFGNWQGQLVYEDTKEGQPELYTSATFSFVVNAHIGDKKKPSLVEIENWEKFIRDGTELIETWEDMEDLRQANEAQRQSNYQELLDTGVLQTNINTKLEALEEEYAPKLTEVIAQLAQTVDDVNRAASELTHDSEVILARSSGVKGKEFGSLDERLEENEEDFEQHKLRYVEQVEVPITNLTTNGDFRDGVDGWVPAWGKIDIQEGMLVFTVTEPRWNTTIRLSSPVNLSIGKYYWRAVVNTPRGHVDFRVGDIANGQDREPGVFDVYSNVVNINSDRSSNNSIYMATGGQPVGTQIIVKNILNINLTDTFGAGNEPTREEMDELIELIGWFDGKITLTQKQQLIWTLHLIRKNRNAITALGGGIV